MQKPTSRLHTSSSTVPRRTIGVICPICGTEAPLVLHRDGMIGIEKHIVCEFINLSLNYNNIELKFRIKNHG